MKTDNRSFIKGAAILGVAGLICKIFGAVYRIPLAQIVGTEGMGAYQIAFPIYALLVVVSSSGLPTAISKLVAESMARGDEAGAARVFRLSFVSLSIIGFVSSVLMYIFADVLALGMGMTAAAPCIRALAPSLLFVASSSALRGYFQGRQLMTPTAVCQLIEQAIKMGAGLFFAYRMAPLGPEYGATGALIGVTLSEIVALGVTAVWYAFKKLPSKPTKGGVRPTLGRVYRIALPVTLGACSGPIVAAIDSAIVMRVLTSTGHTSSQASSLFGLLTGFVTPLINVPGVLTSAVAISLVPAVSAQFVRGGRVSTTARDGLRLALLIGLPSAVAFFALAEPILSTLYHSLTGEELMKAAELMRIMSIAIVFLTVVQISTGILQGIGKTVMPVANMFMGAAVKVFIGISLISVPSVNIRGAAIGTVICFMVVAILDAVMLVRSAQVDFKFNQDFFRPLVCSMIFGVVSSILSNVLTSAMSRGAALAVAILAGGIIYVILLMLFKCITKEDLHYFKRGA